MHIESLVPQNMDDFVKLSAWWRTKIFTEIVISENGVADMLKLIAERKERPFFIVDDVLSDQPVFGPFLEQENKYMFNASDSEPQTGQVDMLVSRIRSEADQTDVIVGIGGGSTIDLAKAVGICLANPKTAAEYQGYGLDMAKGTDIWVLPTLSGTGAEVTPIAVLRGPEKKLGINNNFTAPSLAVIDPQITTGVKKFNRFYTMMDCYFHHHEITHSKTSESNAVLDAHDGMRLAKEVLSEDLSQYSLAAAIKSAMASVLGGSSTIGGRVGVAHAISYGLSNAAPKLPHSVAVAISMLGCPDIYSDMGYSDTLNFLDINNMPKPKASDYGINESHIEKMVKTALGMEKLWLSHFGEDWTKIVDGKFIENIYRRIVFE